MKVQQFVDEGLGNSAHLVISEGSGQAALIDPLRDVDRYLAAAKAAGVHVTRVFETHIHNDFVTGSRELAARLGASAAGNLEFPHDPLRDGDSITVGDVQFTALETPGHTPEHVCYLARDLASPRAQPVLFSGGSLLVGSVARTDLLGQDRAVSLAHELYRSMSEKLLSLPDEVLVYPTHGAGSFCAATPGGARSTTIGKERRSNIYLQVGTGDAFAEELLSGLPSYPTYFGFLRTINQRGPRILGKVPEPPPLSVQEVQEHMGRGEVVIDTRPVASYLRGHIPGAYHVELRPAFGVWVGWVVPFGAPIIMVSETPTSHDEAVRQLLRIGYEDVSGYLSGGMPAWERAGLPLNSTKTLTVQELRSQVEGRGTIEVLDVRADEEWRTAHIPGARHLEAGALSASAITLPLGPTIATHCAQGQRAATALSLLERAGYLNVAYVSGGFEAWQAAGFPTEREDRRPRPGTSNTADKYSEP